MKKYVLSTFVLLVTIVSIGCKKGDTGPAGPAGVNGNANVVQYTFGSNNFATTASVNLAVTTTADTMNNSAWHVYFVRSSGNVYPIPGFGVNGTSEYRVYWNYSSGKANFAISKVSGAGEEYASIRIIRVYANTTMAGGRVAQPDVDFTDYYAVCRYYNLPY